MSTSRRAFLQAAAAASASLLVRGSAHAARPTRTPRSLIQIYLYGGIDALLSTNPKIRSEIDPRVDLTYAEDQIRTHGPSRVGPLFDPIAKWVPEMAILNGVIGGTVAHPTGVRQIMQMRRLFSPAQRGLVQTVGWLNTRKNPVDQTFFFPNPVPNMRPILPAGRSLWLHFDIDEPPKGLLYQLTQYSHDPNRAAIGERLLQQSLGSCHEGCMPQEVASQLMTRLRGLDLPAVPSITIKKPPLSPEWMPGWMASAWASIVRDSIFLLKNHLTSSIFIFAPNPNPGWDTHSDSDQLQHTQMGYFAPGFNELLEQIHTARTADGTPLADEVGLVISSELGRFPFLNGQKGKDHFPEHPVIFMGPGIRPGSYGETDQRMCSTPISARTGKPSHGAGDFTPTIDDVGASVLSWFGIDDPLVAGYTGRRLDFLFA